MWGFWSDKLSAEGIDKKGYMIEQDGPELREVNKERVAVIRRQWRIRNSEQTKWF